MVVYKTRNAFSVIHQRGTELDVYSDHVTVRNVLFISILVRLLSLSAYASPTQRMQKKILEGIRPDVSRVLLADGASRIGDLI